MVGVTHGFWAAQGEAIAPCCGSRVAVGPVSGPCGIDWLCTVKVGFFVCVRVSRQKDYRKP